MVPIPETPLVAVVGATGTGKSAVAIALARALENSGIRAEIVNADAMQLYRGMDIGTAKLSPEDREGIVHHLLDVCPVSAEASVSWFQEVARECIEGLWTEGIVPILVGGSGLYVSAVAFDFSFPGHDDAVRERLERELANLGLSPMYDRLSVQAPEVAALVDPNNARRVIRALEVLEISGDAASLGHLDGQATPWAPHLTVIQCVTQRDRLVERLDARVEDMWSRGLVDEVSRLIAEGLESGVTASRAIGYAQALACIRGEMSREEAVADTQALTRRYARRQVSWFRRYPVSHEVDTTDLGALVLDGDTGLDLTAVGQRLAEALIAIGG